MKPKTCKAGTVLDKLDILAPHVEGYAIEKNGKIYIPIVFVMPAERGKGHLSRFIDSLDSNCVFPCVVSSTLKSILIRKGWKMTLEHSEQFKEDVDVWIHPKAVKVE